MLKTPWGPSELEGPHGVFGELAALLLDDLVALVPSSVRVQAHVVGDHVRQPCDGHGLAFVQCLDHLAVANVNGHVAETAVAIVVEDQQVTVLHLRQRNPHWGSPELV